MGDESARFPRQIGISRARTAQGSDWLAPVQRESPYPLGRACGQFGSLLCAPRNERDRRSVLTSQGRHF